MKTGSDLTNYTSQMQIAIFCSPFVYMLYCCVVCAEYIDIKGNYLR